MEENPSAASKKYDSKKKYSWKNGSFTYTGKNKDGSFEFKNIDTGVTYVFEKDPGMKEVNVAGQNAKTASRRAVGVGGRRRKTRRRRSTLGRR